MMNFGLLFLLSVLSGGVSDLLDVIPADEYWRVKRTEVSEAMIRETLAPPPAAGDISKLLNSLADPSAEVRDATAARIRAMGPAVVPQLKDATQSGHPEVAARAKRLIAEVHAMGGATQVRRLMALRTAGEKKMTGLLPRLKELSTSDDLFTADYAAAAVAAIEGKPHLRAHGKSAGEAWLMPAGTRALVHMEMHGPANPVTSEQIASFVKDMSAALGDEASVEKQTEQARQMFAEIIKVADRVGNVRIDGITVGVSGEIGDNAGFVTVLVRGQWDANALSAAYSEASKDQPKTIAGVTAFEMEHIATVGLISNRYAAAVMGPPDSPKPTEEFFTAVKSGKGPLKDVAEMTALLGKVDMTLPLWGVLHVTDSYRQAPLFKSLDTLILTGKPKGPGMSLAVVAGGRNAAGVGDAVAMVNQVIGQARTELKRTLEDAQNPMMRNPMMRKMADTASKFLESVKCASNEKEPTRATLVAELDVAPTIMFGGLFGMMSVRSMPPPGEFRENRNVEIAPAPPPPAPPAPPRN